MREELAGDEVGSKDTHQLSCEAACFSESERELNQYAMSIIMHCDSNGTETRPNTSR
jgi:hypothetical protein